MLRTTCLYILGALVIVLLNACNNETKPEKTQPTKATPLYQAMSAAQTGIDYKSDYQEDPRDPTGLLHGGASVAAGDINNDGLTDLLFTGGWLNSGLYLNQGGLKFRDITVETGLNDSKEGTAYTESANLVDINGDGWLDVYILKSGIKGNTPGEYGRNLLFINEGIAEDTGLPKFREAAKEFGLDVPGLSVAANFFDYDNDGDLDVYIIQTPYPGPAFSFAYYSRSPRASWFNDQLLENIDGKRFVDVREKAGILYEKNIGLSVSVADINNDGWLDIYVANDFLGRDFLYINQKNKTFKEQHREYFSKTSLSSMGSDFADINNDGWLDLFVGEMMPEEHDRQKQNLVPFSVEIYEQLQRRDIPQYTRNTLHLNRQGEGFRDIGLMAGLYATEWSWSSIFLDADNDGYQDFFSVNGIKRDITNMDFVNFSVGEDYQAIGDPSKQAGDITEVPSVTTPNYIFRNEGDLQFKKMNAQWGISKDIHTRGATYADLDNDGDLDLILNNMLTTPIIYRNTSKDNHYLRLKLEGEGLNSRGLGAKVTLHYEGKTQLRYLANQIGYQSNPEPIVHFGLGGTNKVDSLVVNWLGGAKTKMLNPAVDTLLSISEQGAAKGRNLSQQFGRTLFTEVLPLAGIDVRHKEKDFNDFKRERLLYRQYSKEGPPIAAADVDGDGREDLYIGGAAGSGGTLLIQDKRGRMKAKRVRDLRETKYEETAAVFFDADGDGALDLYLGSGSYEFEENDKSLQDRLLLNNGKGKFKWEEDALPEMLNYTGCVSAGDIDRDGDMDLFVGGRVVPGAYAKMPQSYILINEEGKFKDATEQWAPELKDFGRVSSAIWTDYDNDGDMDLAVVGEWLAVSFFENEGGKFQLNQVPGSAGWWNSIYGVDIDRDGDMDYVAGNHGLNSIFKASPGKPVSMLTADFDENGSVDPVIFKFTGNVNGPFADRNTFASQLPKFNQKYLTFEAYSKATIDNIFEPELLQKARKDEVEELRSVWIENKGEEGFAMHPLPQAAQMAPLYGISNADVNGDQYPDLLLSGNSFSFHYAFGAIDAMQGLVLINQKGEGFKAMSAQQSGINIPHDAKSLISFNHSDGNFWLIAGNNNEAVQVFELENDLEWIPVSSDATHALITAKDGKTQKLEWYQGGGFASQESKGLWLVGDEKIEVFRGKYKIR